MSINSLLNIITVPHNLLLNDQNHVLVFDKVNGGSLYFRDQCKYFSKNLAPLDQLTDKMIRNWFSVLLNKSTPNKFPGVTTFFDTLEYDDKGQFYKTQELPELLLNQNHLNDLWDCIVYEVTNTYCDIFAHSLERNLRLIDSCVNVSLKKFLMEKRDQEMQSSRRNLTLDATDLIEFLEFDNLFPFFDKGKNYTKAIKTAYSRCCNDELETGLRIIVHQIAHMKQDLLPY